MKNILVYFLGNGLGKLFPFLLVPIFTRQLSIEGYGLVASYYAAYQVLVILVGFSSQSLVTMNYYADSNNELSSLGSVRYAATLSVINLLVILLLILMLVDDSHFGAIFLCAIAAFCYQMVLLLGAIYHISQRAFSFVTVTLSSSIVSFGVALASLFNGAGVLSRIYGDLSGYFLFAVISVVLIVRKGIFSAQISIIKLREVYKTLAPLALHGLSVFAIFSADRFIISSVAGNAEVGLYSAAFMLGQVIFLIVDSKSRAWTPIVAKSMKDPVKDRRWFFNMSLIYMAGLLVFCIIFIFLTIPNVERIFGPGYSGIAEFIPFIVFAFWFEAFYRESHVYIFLRGATGAIAKVTVYVGLIHLLLSLFLVQLYGALGAAVAFLISSLLKAVITTLLYYFRFSAIKN